MGIGSIIGKRVQRKAEKKRRKATEAAVRTRNESWLRDSFPKFVLGSGAFEGLTTRQSR
jgi:hypothetical protein